MKLANIILIASFVMTGCYSTGQIPSDNYSPNSNYNNAEVSYQTFYDELQPYGNWIDYPGYGYVWQPNAGADFRPYESRGHWVSTVDGWAWASDYNWGWAPFHYGRWLNDPAFGWAWVPGYEWAPAWVTWGQYNNMYAWAPLSPGINISIGNTWRAPWNYWSYVPNNCIQYRNLNRYVVRNNATVVNNITIINNYNSYNKTNYYHRGPDYRQVEQFTHRTIRPVSIASADRPGATRVDNNNRFEVYRPAVQENRTANRIERPARLTTVNELPQANIRRRDNDGNGVNNTSSGRSFERPATDVQRPERKFQLENQPPAGNAITPGNNNVNPVQNEIRRSDRRLRNEQTVPTATLPETTLPANTGRTFNRPQQVPQNNDELNQRRQAMRAQQQSAENEQNVRRQAEVQRNQNIQRENNVRQQNNELLRQRQQNENRQQQPQFSAPQRQQNVTPRQPQANAQRPVSRPVRRS